MLADRLIEAQVKVAQQQEQIIVLQRAVSRQNLEASLCQLGAGGGGPSNLPSSSGGVGGTSNYQSQTLGVTATCQVESCQVRDLTALITTVNYNRKKVLMHA